MKTNTTNTHFDWETDNLLADTQPEPPQSKKGGLLIAAGIIVAFILTIALAGSCSSDEPYIASEQATPTVALAPTTTLPPLQCGEGYEPVSIGTERACLTSRECEDWQNPHKLTSRAALSAGYLNRCQQKSAFEMGVECGENTRVYWDNETNSWGCKRKTASELRAEENARIAERCAGEPRASAASFRGLDSDGSLGGRCLMLVCDMSKNDSVGDSYWSNYSCVSSWWSESIWAERHRLISESEAEAMEFQSGRQTISDLNKRFGNCVARGYSKVNLITEYDGVGFWCYIS